MMPSIASLSIQQRWTRMVNPLRKKSKSLKKARKRISTVTSLIRISFPSPALYSLVKMQILLRESSTFLNLSLVVLTILLKIWPNA